MVGAVRIRNKTIIAEPHKRGASAMRRTRRALRRSQPHDRRRHDHLQGTAGAADLRSPEPRAIARASTRRAPSSRSAASRWSATPAPTSTARSTATPTATTSPISSSTSIASLDAVVVRVDRRRRTARFRAARSRRSMCAARPCWCTPAGIAHWRTDQYFEDHPFLTRRRRDVPARRGRAARRHRFAQYRRHRRRGAARAHDAARRGHSDRRASVQARAICRRRVSAFRPCRRKCAASARFRCARSRWSAADSERAAASTAARPRASTTPACSMRNCVLPAVSPPAVFRHARRAHRRDRRCARPLSSTARSETRNPGAATPPAARASKTAVHRHRLRAVFAQMHRAQAAVAAQRIVARCDASGSRVDRVLRPTRRRRRAGTSRPGAGSACARIVPNTHRSMMFRPA